jgi:hypothetical protein
MLFHYKRDAEEDILQYFKEIIDYPIIGPLLFRERTRVDKKE